ncbi:class I SAM-dependent methyltransferase [Amycolatopsis oliviviridis]|uniref:SAM-dependent methyltransferase n=1 Tax=Amycolatopsis oliviviridis TaxID=1471590 RepID=A0ABQ3MKV4_9PSEU|nr:class I SAM-dependent methyltransferase [Amycolatopsis oliviviridis]GHH37866.1 SAM-dependent methyltransferase [Amycolatopsis oliviviridis]
MTEAATWEDELATVERDAAVSEPMVRQAVRWLARTHPLGDGSLVLDVGSGPGSATVILAEEFPDSEVIAVDPTVGFTARATARFAEHGLGRRVRAGYGEIGTSSLSALGPADLVWCAHVVHHLPDPVAALRELSSLLVPGSGVLAVAEGGLSARFLPGGYGVGNPGFVSRLEAALSDHFVGSWSLTGAAVGGGRDWPLLLADAGLRHRVTRTFLLDLPAPASPEVRGHVVDRFTRIQRLVGPALSEEDSAALARLLDPADPVALVNRPDLFVLQATTWHLGSRI